MTFPLQGQCPTWFRAFWRKSWFWSNQVYFQCTMIFKGLVQVFQCIGICMRVVRATQNLHLQVMQIRLGIMIPCSGCVDNLPRGMCEKLRRKDESREKCFSNRLCPMHEYFLLRHSKTNMNRVFICNELRNNASFGWLWFSFALVASEKQSWPKKAKTPKDDFILEKASKVVLKEYIPLP